MREFLWVAATITLALMLFRSFRGPNHPEPPTDPWFQAEVVRPSESRPVLVKFGAEWCGPCRAMEPQLDKLDSQLAGALRVVRIDVDERPSLSEHYGISGIPRTLVFRNGQVVGDRVGYLSTDVMRSWVSQWTN